MEIPDFLVPFLLLGGFVVILAIVEWLFTHDDSSKNN